MENASKALIIVASVLIGIMLLSFMVFMFKRFNSTAKDTDKRLEQREIDEINSKFTGYETGSHSLEDSFFITYNRQSVDGSVNTQEINYKKLFGTSSSSTRGVSDDYYNKALIVASQDLNTVSDVVSAINDAIDTNNRNSNNYLYNSVEIQNSVEVIVDLGNNYTEFNFNKVGATSQFQNLIIEPSRNVKAKHIYGFNKSFGGKEISSMNKETRAKTLTFENDSAKSGYNSIKTYDMLAELRDTKIIVDSLKSYTVHKYYFFGEIKFNDLTGLVETVKFTLVKDNFF